MNFKSMNSKRKNFVQLGFFVIFAKILLLRSISGCPGLIIFFDIFLNTLFLFVTEITKYDLITQELSVTHFFLSIIMFMLGFFSIIYSCLSKTPVIIEKFLLASGINAFLAVILFSLSFPEICLNVVNENLETEKKWKEMEPVKEKAELMVNKLKEAIYIVKTFRKESKDVSNRFSGKEKELINNTVFLIKDFLNNSLYRLDTEKLAESEGFNKNYSKYFEGAFTSRGFYPFSVKDSVTFSNVAEYGFNYLKVVKSLDESLDSSNVELLEDLYNEINNICKKARKMEENEKKTVLDNLMQKEITKLRKARDIS